MAKNKKRVKIPRSKTYKNKPVFEYYMCTCEKNKKDRDFLKEVKNVDFGEIEKNEIFFATQMIDSNAHADFVNYISTCVMSYNKLTDLIINYLFIYEEVGDDFLKQMDISYKQEMVGKEPLDDMVKMPLYRFSLFQDNQIFILKRNINGDKFTHVDFGEIEKIFDKIMIDFTIISVFLSLKNENKKTPTYNETVEEYLKNKISYE